MVFPCSMKIKNTLLNIDNRLFEARRILKTENLEMVLVKGIVWNKGKILQGADLDFYIENNEFIPYESASENARKNIQNLFSGMLISPRKDDYNIEDRVKSFYVDAEMRVGLEESNVTFANDESKTFFIEGVYNTPPSFKPNKKQVIFVLNRCLEEGGDFRRMERKTYLKLLDFCKINHSLYYQMLSSFWQENGLLRPPFGLDYKKLVLENFNGANKEDFIYIKPLHKALEEVLQNE